jgi:hypothetical protein
MFSAGCDYDIIDIQDNVGGGSSSPKDEQRGVTPGGHKPNRVKECGEPKKPCARRLFDSIKRFLELAIMSGMSNINKASRLSAINRLREFPMQSGILNIFNIQFMNRPRLRSCNAKNHANCGGLHHGTEGFTIINTFLLSKTTKDPMSFVSCQGAI